MRPASRSGAKNARSGCLATVQAVADSWNVPVGERAASWPQFKERHLRPLEAVRGRLVWQFGENEELVRMFLDDSLSRAATTGGRIGCAAISTFRFGNPDSPTPSRF